MKPCPCLYAENLDIFQLVRSVRVLQVRRLTEENCAATTTSSCVRLLPSHRSTTSSEPAVLCPVNCRTLQV
jgi:hypothetical protein